MHLQRRHGAPEPHHAGADPPPHAANERSFEVVEKPLGRVLSALRLLQLLPDSPQPAGHARASVKDREPYLDDQGTTEISSNET